MILFLVLQCRYDDRGRHYIGTGRRLVSVDLDKPEERRDLQRFRTASGLDSWGLSCGKRGDWWRVEDAFEFHDVTLELHEGKYPLSEHLTESQLTDIIMEAKKNDNQAH